jgi:hypothetical protein
MSFQRAVRATPAIAPHYRPGLQALRRQDASMMRIADGRRLDGSVALDEVLQYARWDYGVGIRARANQVQAIWIEIHPASSSHVGGVLAKLDWLRNWLRDEAPAFAGIRARYVRLATGTVALPQNSPKRKLIASQGLEFCAKLLNLDEFTD